MMKKFEWQLEHGQEIVAARTADDLARRQRFQPPIDPLKVVELEKGSLRAGGDNFKNSFDGKLKYFPSRQRFILLYNTKYDEGYDAGPHHPRTRFSIAHELGHYFIDAHREYLLQGGLAHASKSEFRRQNQRIEREADAFAASLLLPTHLVQPKVNEARPSLDLIDSLSREFQTSPVCTTFRIVNLSGDPCAVAGLRDGEIAWMFPSERLIEGECYPRRGKILSDFAHDKWDSFVSRDTSKVANDGLASEWLSLYGRAADIDDLSVREHYLPVRVMETLVVLLTLNDEELFGFDEGGSVVRDSEDDEDYGSWTKERHDSGD
jgi:IrrE N-terminal-like domain